MSAHRIVLVTGGARSGKSRFALASAQALAEELLPRVFLATAEGRDEEMAERIARHQSERGANWRTIEEPREIARVLAEAKECVVVVDCLTLWIANLMDDDPAYDSSAALEDLARVLETRRSSVIVVTNEVGAGIVPDNPLARAFRDRVGEANARIAELADEVHLLVAGLPLRVK